MLKKRRVLLEPASMELRFSEEALEPKIELDRVNGDSIRVRVAFQLPSTGRRFPLSNGAWFEGTPGWHIDTTEGVMRPLAPQASTVVGIGLDPLTLLAALGVMALIAFALTCVGLVVAWPMDSVQGFHALMMLVLLPMWLLSGAFFPVGNAHPVMAWIMCANPLTYGVTALRGVLGVPVDAGQGLPGTGVSVVVTAAFAVVMLFLRRPRKPLAAFRTFLRREWLGTERGARDMVQSSLSRTASSASRAGISRMDAFASAISSCAVFMYRDPISDFDGSPRCARRRSI